mgnify:CR=1 FL=1
MIVFLKHPCGTGKARRMGHALGAMVCARSARRAAGGCHRRGAPVRRRGEVAAGSLEPIEQRLLLLKLLIVRVQLLASSLVLEREQREEKSSNHRAVFKTSRGQVMAGVSVHLGEWSVAHWSSSILQSGSLWW